MYRANSGIGAKRGHKTKPVSHCGKCGKECSLPEWENFQVNKAVDNSDWTGRAKKGLLKDSESNIILDSRTVQSDDYEDGFLALHPNKRIPKR